MTEPLDGVESKLLSATIKSENAMRWRHEHLVLQSESDMAQQVGLPPSFQVDSTGFMAGFSSASPSGIILKKNKPRKHPYKNRRNPKVKEDVPSIGEVCKKVGAVIGTGEKRKAKEDHEHLSKSVRLNKPEMVPIEGLSNI